MEFPSDETVFRLQATMRNVGGELLFAGLLGTAEAAGDGGHVLAHELRKAAAQGGHDRLDVDEVAKTKAA